MSLLTLLRSSATTLQPSFVSELEMGRSNDATSHESDPFDVVADTMYLVTLYTSVASGSANLATLTCSNGDTCDHIVSSAGLHRQATYRFRASVSEVGATLTASYAGQTNQRCVFVVDRVVDEDTSGTNGSGAIGQSKAPAGAATSTNPLITFNNPLSDPNNAAYGVVGSATGPANIAPTATWTEISETPLIDSAVTCASLSKIGSQSVSWATVNASYRATAVEIKGAPAAGPTEMSFSGSVTPVGTLLKQDNKGLAGVVTPAASLTKEIGRSFVAQTTPVGVVIKQSSKVFGGSATPSGLVQNQTNQQLEGTVTPTGSLLRSLSKELTGLTTPTGLLSKSVSKVFAAAVTPSGALSRQVTKGFTGEVVPTGTLDLLLTLLVSFAGSVTLWVRF